MTYDPEEVHDKLWDGFSGRLGWDIGANAGQSVNRMISQFEYVVAVEPAHESFRMLQEDWGDHDRVDLLNMAVSDHTGTMQLSVRQLPIISGQLVDPEVHTKTSQRLMGWWTEEQSRRDVPCVTLNDMAHQYGMPDFVKIDTEGGEEKILQGASQLIEAGSVKWLIEFHSPQLRRACMDMLDGCQIEWVRNPPEAADHGDDAETDDTGWLRVTP